MMHVLQYLPGTIPHSAFEITDVPNIYTTRDLPLWRSVGSAYHQLTCSSWAGRSWKEGHDIVVKALKSYGIYENHQLGLCAVDSDFLMKTMLIQLLKNGGMLL